MKHVSSPCLEAWLGLAQVKQYGAEILSDSRIIRCGFYMFLLGMQIFMHLEYEPALEGVIFRGLHASYMIGLLFSENTIFAAVAVYSHAFVLHDCPRHWPCRRNENTRHEWSLAKGCDLIILRF